MCHLVCIFERELCRGLRWRGAMRRGSRLLRSPWHPSTVSLSKQNPPPLLCIMRLSHPTSRDPSNSFLFSRVAWHLSGRLERKTGFGFLPWLPSSKLYFPTPLVVLTSFLLVSHLLRWRLTLSLDLFRPPLFILWLTPCETIPMAHT